MYHSWYVWPTSSHMLTFNFKHFLKNRKRNWSHRQSRHDNMYALDNCDDVAKAKAAVAAPQ